MEGRREFLPAMNVLAFLEFMAHEILDLLHIGRRDGKRSGLAEESAE